MSASIDESDPKSAELQALTDSCESLAMQLNVAEGRRRQFFARLNSSVLPTIRSSDGARLLARSVLEEDAPWNELAVPSCPTPGMITEEEKRYYVYLGAFYSGAGHVLELGPWLGLSTFYILQGLKQGTNAEKLQLHIVDDFTWRSEWMDPYVDRFGLAPSLKPKHHESFLPLFEHFSAPIIDRLVIHTQRISTSAENAHLPEMSWKEGPIEICYVDCGRTIDANEGWYRVLRPWFIPGRTLIVMQDWQLHKEIPIKWYNQIKQFTDSKGDDLDLIHELCDGGVATFMYRGR
jgi:hypothetical protein